MLSTPFDDVRGPRALLEPWVERARQHPEARCVTLVGEDGSENVLTAGSLLDAAVAYRAGLERLGVDRGDIVILALGHSPELIAAFLGCVHAGIVPAVSSVYRAGEQPIDAYGGRLKAMVAAAGATALVTAPAHAEALREVGCRVVSTVEIAAAATPEPDDEPAPVEDQLAFLQYTSGSGGVAKGVAHTHGTVLRYIESKRRAQPIGAADVVVSWLPLYHDLGLVSGLLSPLVLGVPTVLISPFHWVRAPAVLFRAVHRHRGTLCFLPNFALNHCARAVRDRDLEGLDLSCWKALVCGAEMVRADSLELFAGRFAAYGFRREALRAGYGMAEMVEGVTVTPPGDAPRVDRVERDALQRRRRAQPAGDVADAVAVVSCGAPMPGVCLRIVDDAGVELGERQVGEIALRGDFMFSGYYRQPEPTRSALRDGWFLTGDLGYVAAGELYVTGRKTDLIIVGGRNVQPEELERLADQVSGLRPGRSVAFGVADAAAGSERVVLVCEIALECVADEKHRIEQELRRRSVQEIGVSVGDVRFVGKGWIVKTSSGKHARPANREKYLRDIAAGCGPRT